jgi:CheY-like chemotaxis protein
LVEDDKSVRVTCSRLLEVLGYTLFAAKTPAESLKIAAAHPADIDLLLTDMVMPGMNGSQLAERIGEMKPHVKVLFMSGYTADVITQRDGPEQSVSVIGKPFTRDALARKVRDVLDAESNSHPSSAHGVPVDSAPPP